MAINTTATKLGNLISDVQTASGTIGVGGTWQTPSASEGLIQVDYAGGFNFDSMDASQPLLQHADTFIMGIHRWGDPKFKVTT